MAEAATEHAHHRAHHRDGAREGSHQSGGEEVCGGHIHLGRNILRGGGWESARGSGRAGCSLGVHGEISGRSHQWVGSLGGGSGPGRVHGRGRVESGRDEDFLSWLPWFLGVSYIHDAVHSGSLELASVELLHGRLQIIGGFEFNKPCLVLMWSFPWRQCVITHPLPNSRPASE